MEDRDWELIPENKGQLRDVEKMPGMPEGSLERRLRVILGTTVENVKHRQVHPYRLFFSTAGWDPTCTCYKFCGTTNQFLLAMGSHRLHWSRYLALNHKEELDFIRKLVKCSCSQSHSSCLLCSTPFSLYLGTPKFILTLGHWHCLGSSLPLSAGGFLSLASFHLRGATLTIQS